MTSPESQGVPNPKQYQSYLLRQLMSSLVTFSQRFPLGGSIHAFRESELEPIHIRIRARLFFVFCDRFDPHMPHEDSINYRGNGGIDAGVSTALTTTM